jgi:starch phosphorylase
MKQCLPEELPLNYTRRVSIFGGKAAPGYYIAKLVIKLINCVANKVNDDTDCEGLLKVIFFQNYNVSLAELLIPASDLSQHISTAGMEASGTSNMKFAINGGLIIGTLDGANIEIKEEIGEENMFIFGTKAEDVENERKRVREGKVKVDPRLEEVINMLQSGTFGEFIEIHHLLNSFLHGNDYYLLTVDWKGYLEAQDRVDKAFLNKEKWTRMSIMSTAGMGKFSSDRSIHNYAHHIWNLKPCKRPGPIPVDTGAMAKGVGSSLARFARSVSPLDSISPISNVIAMERLSAEDQEIVQSYSPSSSPYSSNY